MFLFVLLEIPDADTGFPKQSKTVCTNSKKTAGVFICFIKNIALIALAQGSPYNAVTRWWGGGVQLITMLNFCAPN